MNLSVSRFVGLAGLFLTQCISAFAASDPALLPTASPVPVFSDFTHTWQLSVPFNNARGTHTVTLVFAPGLRERIPFLTHEVFTAIPIVEEAQGVELRDDFSIYFDTEADFLNGFTTVIPSNRIAIYTEAATVESTIGLSQDYILETLVHELGHMLPLQQRGGLFSGLSAVFGNASRPVGLWPRWIHEGLAVWTESHVAPPGGGLGGRPGSGFLDFELRRFSEFYQRRKMYPVRDIDLDGRSEMLGMHEDRVRVPHARAQPGDMPYHFGYLLLQDWASQKGGSQPFRDFVTDSGRSMGLSFREIFRKDGANLDVIFANAQKKWGTAPLLGPLSSANKEEPLAKAETIFGPFQSDVGISWIEYETKSFIGGTSDVRIGFRRFEIPEPGTYRDSNLKTLPTLGPIKDDKGKTVLFAWNEELVAPVQAVALSQDTLAVLVHMNPRQSAGRSYDPDAQPHNRLWVVNTRGQVLCRLPTPEAFPDRVREINFHQGYLSWIRSTLDGIYIVERATFHARASSVEQGCHLGRVEELTRSRHPFERLSHVYADADNWMLSRSEGLDSYSEFIEWNGTTIHGFDKSPVALSVPAPLPPEAGCRGCLLVHEFSRKYWGPVLLKPVEKGFVILTPATQYQAWRLPLATGAFRSVVDESSGRVVVKEALWEADRLQAHDWKEFTTPGPAIRVQLANKGSEVNAPAPDVSVKEYSALPSLVPQFWIPSAAVVAGGFLFSAQTFYYDLRTRWSGSTLLGYDSYVRRPFASTALTRSRLQWGPFSSITGALDYSPVLNLFSGESQDRFDASLALTSYTMVSSNWRLAVGPGLSYSYASETGGLEGYHQPVPFLETALASSRGKSEFDITNRLARTSFGFYLKNRSRYIKGFETYTSGNLHFPIYQRFGMQFGAEHGFTDFRNFPFSYFQWGGLPTFATSPTNFLARGFPILLLAGPQILRSSASFGFSWGNLNTALSWDRARLNYLDMRFLAESVTTFHMFQKFYTTVGTEVDLYGAAIHYVNYKLTAGYYYGFGKAGVQQFALLLRSFLDVY